MSQNPCIAFFDSGQGGLTVWEAVLRRLPRLNTIYLGDNARYPYGNKGNETITRYASEAALFLTRRNAALIVVACGTASNVAVTVLQKMFRVPIVGIVEGFCADAAELGATSGTIAVLGTRFTVACRRFEEELRGLGAQRIWQRACPLFVPLVEEGIPPGPIADAVTEMYLWDIPADVSVVMLACTHFPRLVQSIATTLERRLGRQVNYLSADGCWQLTPPNGTRPVTLLDSSRAIVKAVSDFVESHPEKSSLQQEERRLYCSDAPERFSEVARLFASIDLPPAECVVVGP